MSSMTKIKRARFLSALDGMLMRDRQGAIDDMLQVLCERGVVKRAYAERAMNSNWLGEDGYRAAVDRDVAVDLVRLLHDEGGISFTERQEEPFLTRRRGMAQFVLRTSPKNSP